MSSPSERKNYILNQLIAESPPQATDIQKVLRLYQVGKSESSNKKSFNKAIAADIAKTLDYLHVTGADKNDKSTNINKLLVRINALFPSPCTFCKTDYAVHRTEIPLLSCAKCDQGIHGRCLAQALGISEADLQTKTREDVKTKINPLNIPSMSYLCGPCHEILIPDEPDCLKIPTTTQGPISTPILVTADEASQADTDDGASSARGNHSIVPKTVILSQNPSSTARYRPSITSNQDAAEYNGDSDDDSNSELESSPRRRRKSKKTKSPDLTSRKPKNKTPTVCAFFRKGECRHGISGKGCAWQHPSLCHKLMTFGDNKPRGCSKGTECDKFHPKMCPSSLSSRECLNETCTLYHVKGTMRKNSKPHSTPTKNKDPTITDRDPPVSVKSGESKPNPQEAFSSSFLDVLNTWTKQFMLTLEEKLTQNSQVRLLPPTMLNNHHHHLNNQHQLNNQHHLTAAVPQAAVLLPQSQMIHQGHMTQPLRF